MRALLTAFMLCLTLSAWAAAPPVSSAPSIAFTRYHLDNGLEVILAPDKRLPVVAVNLWYHVGAANETPDRTGFAHLFEHMMFTGTKHSARGESERLTSAWPPGIWWAQAWLLSAPHSRERSPLSAPAGPEHPDRSDRPGQP